VIPESANRALLDGVDRERTPVDPPTGLGPQVFVVVAQVPRQIRDLVGVARPMVGDARDAAQRIVRFLAACVHLADDGVFGAVNGRERRHRRVDAVVATVKAHRFERVWRVGKV
jgi:hypothetical protein